MEKRMPSAAIAVLLAVTFLLEAAAPAHAQFSRRNPFVEAIDRTRPSIVTVKVQKRGNWGTKEVVGTGVIVDQRGYIITNSHVVNNSDGVAVHMHDGTYLTAQVITDDPRHDLAILHIKTSKKLRPLPFG